MDKKKLRNDIILISSLLIAAVVALVVVLLTRAKTNLVAKVAVQNNVVLVIDLSNKNDQDFEIDGLKGKLHVHTHSGAIAVTSSNCPHQDCVKMGYVDTSNRPIICAYNAVTIFIESVTAGSDVVI